MKGLIEGFGDRYEICSETQRVYDLVKGRFISVFIDTNSKTGKEYKKVYLSINGTGKSYHLHRLLALTFIPNDDQTKTFIDHIDKESLNNDLSNLRWVTAKENMQNQKKQKNTSSKFMGVSFNKQNKKWRAEIRLNYKSKYLGYFVNEIEAAYAYDKVAKENGYLHYNFAD